MEAAAVGWRVIKQLKYSTLNKPAKYFCFNNP